MNSQEFVSKHINVTVSKYREFHFKRLVSNICESVSNETNSLQNTPDELASKLTSELISKCNIHFNT